MCSYLSVHDKIHFTSDVVADHENVITMNDHTYSITYAQQNVLLYS